jgi:hypothetical protein
MVSLIAVAGLHRCLGTLPPIRREGAPHIIHLLELPAGVPLRKHFVAARIDLLPLRAAVSAVT